MGTCRGGRSSREERRRTLLRTPDGELPYASCLPYGGMCAIHNTSQKVACARQVDQTKDDHGSLLPPSQRTRAGETSALAVDVAAAAGAGAGERERDVDGAMIPEELSPWLAGPVFMPSSHAGW